MANKHLKNKPYFKQILPKSIHITMLGELLTREYVGKMKGKLTDFYRETNSLRLFQIILSAFSAQMFSCRIIDENEYLSFQ